MNIFTRLQLTQKRRWISARRNLIEQSTCKQYGFFDHQNYIEKIKWKHRAFFDHRNYIEKSTWNNVDILPGLITPKKVCGNNVNFPTIEITLKIVRANDVDFLISDITSKKYVEMTWKFVEIWSSAYQRNIHLESTSIWRGVPVGMCPENMMTWLEIKNLNTFAVNQRF